MSIPMRALMCGTLAVLMSCKDAKPADPGPKPAAEAAAPAPAGTAKGCAFLSEAEVAELTGVAVTTHEHGNPQSCALFKTAKDDRDFLLVATDSSASYPRFLASSNEQMFPVRKPLTGVGSEALLLRASDAPEAIHAVIGRNAARTVVLTPMSGRAPITDAQLTELARRALAKP